MGVLSGHQLVMGIAVTVLSMLHVVWKTGPNGQCFHPFGKCEWRCVLDHNTSKGQALVGTSGSGTIHGRLERSLSLSFSRAVTLEREQTDINYNSSRLPGQTGGVPLHVTGISRAILLPNSFYKGMSGRHCL